MLFTVEYFDGWWNVIHRGQVVDGFECEEDAYSYISYINRKENV